MAITLLISVTIAVSGAIRSCNSNNNKKLIKETESVAIISSSKEVSVRNTVRNTIVDVTATLVATITEALANSGSKPC